jgi:hypothetical protein
MHKWLVILCIHSLTLWNGMTHNTFDIVSQTDYQLRWLTDFDEPCVFVVHMNDAIWQKVVWVPVRRPLPMFHRPQLSDLTRCPPSQRNRSRLIRRVSQRIHCCASFKWCGTHLAAVLCIFKSRRKILSTWDPKITVCSANSFTLQRLTSLVQCEITVTDTGTIIQFCLSYSWRSWTSLSRRPAIFTYECCSSLRTSISELYRQHNNVTERNACALL